MFVFDREILGNLFASIFSKERKINFPNLQDIFKTTYGYRKQKEAKVETGVGG